VWRFASNPRWDKTGGLLMKKRVSYFATPKDLRDIIETLDSRASYQYIEYRNFTIDEYCNAWRLSTLLAYPTIGMAKSGKCDQDIFLVLPKDQELQLKYLQNGNRVVVSQELNIPSITWSLGGLWKETMLIKGEVSSVHSDTVTESMMKEVQYAFSKHCLKRKGYFVSKEVINVPNFRLITIGETQPTSYDLVLS
jgi:hypothetical protein